MNRLSVGVSVSFWLASLVLGWCCTFGLQDEDGKPPVLPQDTLPAIKLDAPLPLGITQKPAVPEVNPLTDQSVSLGRKLFFDPILSDDDTVSCASCHQPEHGFASPDAKAIGVRGRVGKRNAPSLFNKAYAKHLFWDGRSDSLEDQALQPLTNPDELGSDLDLILGKLQKSEEYVALFEEAFETPDQESAVTAENLGKAIASFERTLILGNTRVDRFHAADYEALNQAARQGMWIFESRGRCWKCHNSETFSDQKFHNTGVSFGQKDRDTGRHEHTKNQEHRFQFKTPSLRGVAETAPYMHDGSVKTLRDVVEFYNQGGSPKDPLLSKDIQPLNLTEQDVDNLVEFLKALSK